MGLLQKVSYSGITDSVETSAAAKIAPLEKKSNSVGLLKKSLTVSHNDKLDFFEFIIKYNLSLAAILRPNENFYSIYKSYGFDGKSICLSYSSKDFWDGSLLLKNTLYTFKAGTSEILPYYQFFSEEIKDSIELIHLFKMDDNSIFLFTTDNSYTIPKSFVFDLINLDLEKNSFDSLIKPQLADNVFIYDIDLSEALESFVLSNSRTNKDIIQAISNQLYVNLVQYFPQPDFLEKISAGKFKLYFSNPEKLPLELFANHLRIQIKETLENHSELIKVNLQAE